MEGGTQCLIPDGAGSPSCIFPGILTFDLCLKTRVESFKNTVSRLYFLPGLAVFTLFMEFYWLRRAMRMLT